MTLSSPVSCAAAPRQGAGEPKQRDRADYEATQMVPTPDAGCPGPAAPVEYAAYRDRRSATSHARPVHAPTAERLAASERERRARKRRRGWLASCWW